MPPLAGGPPVTIAEGAGFGAGASWGPNDSIVFAPSLGSGLWRVASAGGAPRILTSPDAEAGERGHLYPDILPGGEAVLFSVSSRPRSYSVAVLQFETGESKVLLEGRRPRYVPTGHLVYSRMDGTLHAVPFDPVRLQVTGPPVFPVPENMLAGPSGAVDFDFSRTGTLIYAPGSASQSALVMVDRHGAARPLVAERRAFRDPRFSPSGDRVAVATAPPSGYDVWTADTEGGGLVRLTLAGLNVAPVWTIDGRSVISRCVLSSPFFTQERYNAAAANPIGSFPADTSFFCAACKTLIA